MAQVGPSREQGRKRAHPSEAPSTSSVADRSEDEVNPFISEEERGELLSSEESSDEEEVQPAAKRKFVPTEEVKKFLDAVSLKPLKNEKRKTTMNRYPVPACDPAHPPVLDESVASLVPKSAKTYDSFLSKLQRFTLDAMGPLTWLLDEKEQGREVDVDSAVRASLTLLGNASAHFSVERRRSMLKHLNKDLKPLAEAEFPNRGAHLFGEDIGKRAKKMAENVSALKGLQTKRGRFSGGGDFNRRFSASKSQSRRPNWGVTPATRKSVFRRLDTVPRSQQYQKPNKQKDQNK